MRGWITKHVAKYGTKLPTNWELLKGGDWSLEKWLWSMALSPLCRLKGHQHSVVIMRNVEECNVTDFL